MDSTMNLVKGYSTYTRKDELTLAKEKVWNLVEAYSFSRRPRSDVTEELLTLIVENRSMAKAMISILLDLQDRWIKPGC